MLPTVLTATLSTLTSLHFEWYLNPRVPLSWTSSHLKLLHEVDAFFSGGVPPHNITLLSYLTLHNNQNFLTVLTRASKWRELHILFLLTMRFREVFRSVTLLALIVASCSFCLFALYLLSDYHQHMFWCRQWVVGHGIQPNQPVCINTCKICWCCEQWTR